MNIWISTNALAAAKKELLQSGALYGLKHLQELGHSLGFDPKNLSDRQQALLENEQIQSADFAKKESHLLVTKNDSMLEASDSDGKIITKGAHWVELSDRICFPVRKAKQERKTAETDIEIALNLDGSGQSNISTGLDFFDHMLDQIAKHGLIDLEISCNGDLNVDEHHTIEDIAIALGETINKALGNKIGIERYGFTLPMDETLSTVALDLSGRPFLVFNADFKREYVGDFPTEMAKHFFYSLAMNMKATLHVSVEGENDHHKIEACFKGFARCLRAAVSRSERNVNILPSTKDLL